MRKILGLIAVFALTLALCSTAAAARKQFTDFSLDIPDGWASQEHTDEKGHKTAILTKGDTTAMIGLEPLAGKTLKQQAEDFSKQVGGKVEDLGDDTWAVTFKGQDGKETNVILIGEKGGDIFCGIAITGSLTGDVLAIVDSLE